MNSSKVFSNRANESFVAAKYEAFYQFDPRNELSAGVQVQTANKWQNEVWAQPDTSRFDLNGDGVYETGPVVIPEASVSQTITFGQASKYYAYVSDKFAVTSDLALTLGLRYDHFTFSGKGTRESSSALVRRWRQRRAMVFNSGISCSFSNSNP